MTIYTLSGIAGSGKTERLIGYAAHRITHHKKTVFVSRSKDLCEQTRKRLIAAGIAPSKITMIYSERRNANSVGTRLMDHLKLTKPDAGEILICTHAAFFACHHWHRPELWCPLIDEVPQIHVDLSRRLYQNFAILTDLLEPEDLSQPYTTIAARDAASEDILRLRLDLAMRDEINEQQRELISALLDPNWSVQCESRNWQQVAAGIQDNDDDETKEQRSKLHFYGFLQPGFFNAFDKPVIAAACIEDHLFYQVWQQLGADLRPATHITDQFGDCSKMQHDGTRLVLRVLAGPHEDRLWSKTYAETVLSDGSTPRQTIRKFCEAHLKAGEYAFVTNAKPNMDDIPTGAILLGPHCHGLNHLRHIKTIVISSALVPDRHYQAYLRSLGVSDECIHRDIAWITAYQGMMRTALRDAGAEKVTCYISDPFAARYIAGLFPGCTVEYVPCFAAPVEQQKRGPKPKLKTEEQKRLERNARDRLRRHVRKRGRAIMAEASATFNSAA